MAGCRVTPTLLSAVVQLAEDDTLELDAAQLGLLRRSHRRFRVKFLCQKFFFYMIQQFHFSGRNRTPISAAAALKFTWPFSHELCVAYAMIMSTAGDFVCKKSIDSSP